jgi:hypothetical protein
MCFTFATCIFVTYSNWALLIEWLGVSFSGLYHIGVRFYKE